MRPLCTIARCSDAKKTQQHVLAPRLPRCEDDFGVRLGAEGRAARFEFATNLKEIVDFAVEDDDMTAVDRQHRLVTACTGIDDCQTSVAESYVPLSTKPGPSTIRATMRQQTRQTIYLLRLDYIAAKIYDARNPAHD